MTSRCFKITTEKSSPNLDWSLEIDSRKSEYGPANNSTICPSENLNLTRLEEWTSGSLK